MLTCSVTQPRSWETARGFMASITGNFNESAQLNNKSQQSQVSAPESPTSPHTPLKVD